MKYSKILPYLQIARFDHWFKNIFVLPGILVAVYIDNQLLNSSLTLKVIIALLSTGFIASSNYIINEILDAPKDKIHPVKRNRPVPSGKINIKIGYILWLALAVIGLVMAYSLGRYFFYSAIILWIMGCIYNIPPLRSKEKPYLDVLSESVNNPIRLMLGWYCTGITLFPPISLVIAYWMIGAFFMAAKRFAEYRMIDDAETAKIYRSSFAHYNEERLITSIIYYVSAFGLFFGIFLIRYKMELILSIPLIAGFVAWYLHLAFKHNSPVQYPEKLYTEKNFVVYTISVFIIMLSLLFVDIPVIYEIFSPTRSH